MIPTHIRTSTDGLSFRWDGYAVRLGLMIIDGGRRMDWVLSDKAVSVTVYETQLVPPFEKYPYFPDGLLAATSAAIAASRDPKVMLARALDDYRLAGFELVRRWRHAEAAGVVPVRLEENYPWVHDCTPPLQHFDSISSAQGAWATFAVEEIGVPH